VEKSWKDEGLAGRGELDTSSTPRANVRSRGDACSRKSTYSYDRTSWCLQWDFKP